MLQLFKDLSIRTKLFVLIGIMLGFLVMVGMTGYYFLIQAEQSVAKIYNENLLNIAALDDARAHARAIESDMFQLMQVSEKNQELALLKDIQDRGALFDKNLERYETSSLTLEEQRMLVEVKKNLTQYRETRKPLFQMLASGQRSEAYTYYLNNISAHDNAFQKDLRDLAEYKTKTAEKIYETNSKQLGQAKNIMAAAAATAVVLAVLLGLFIAGLITKPLVGVVEAIRQVSEGNLAIKHLDNHSKDETGKVSVAINTMLTNLRDLIEQTIHTSQQMAASSEELTASAQQSAEASNQVAASISEVSYDIEKQNSAIGETTVTVEQISALMEEAAATASQVAALADKAAATTDNGQSAVGKAVRQMDNIGGSARQITEAIHELKASSHQINEFAGLISDIATQTNLLALNAAIEAARAGEHGRGFAVVAEEVRKLAEQSDKAAKEVIALLKKNNNNISYAVQSMETATVDIRDGIEMVNTAGSGFGEIDRLVRQVSEQVRRIAEAIGGVAEGSQRVVTAVRDIQTASREASAETQSVSAATEEQSAAAEEIASASQSLAGLAEQLHSAVGRFKI